MLRRLVDAEHELQHSRVPRLAGQGGERGGGGVLKSLRRRSPREEGREAGSLVAQLVAREQGTIERKLSLLTSDILWNTEDLGDRCQVSVRAAKPLLEVL